MEKRLEDEEYMEHVEVLGGKKVENTNELLGIKEDKDEMSVFLGLIFIIAIFFVFHFLHQKNNLETIEILVNENDRLKEEIKELNMRNRTMEALKKIENVENLPLLNPDDGGKK